MPYLALIAVVAGVMYGARTRTNKWAALGVRLLGILFIAAVFAFFLHLHRISGGPDGGMEHLQLYFPGVSMLIAMGLLAADGLIGWKKEK